MHYIGLAGHMRRIYDPYQYTFLKDLQPINQFITISAFVLGASQILFFVNFFWSAFKGQKAGENPWNANGLEWTTPSPPPARQLAGRDPRGLPLAVRLQRARSAESDHVMQTDPAPVGAACGAAWPLRPSRSAGPPSPAPAVRAEATIAPAAAMARGRRRLVRHPRRSRPVRAPRVPGHRHDALHRVHERLHPAPHLGATGGPLAAPPVLWCEHGRARSLSSATLERRATAPAAGGTSAGAQAWRAGARGCSERSSWPARSSAGGSSRPAGSSSPRTRTAPSSTSSPACTRCTSWAASSGSPSSSCAAPAHGRPRPGDDGLRPVRDLLALPGRPLALPALCCSSCY